MNRILPWLFIVAVLGGAAWWFLASQSGDDEPATETPPPVAAAPEPDAGSGTEAPPTTAPPRDLEDRRDEPVEPEPEPLPPLADSDPVVIDRLGEWFGPVTVGPILESEAIVPRVVATIDNLDRGEVPDAINPLRPVPESFRVSESGAIAGEDGLPVKTYTMSPANARRYADLVELVEAAETDTLVAAYQRYYPWFQQAYADLGYPDRAFNDRLLAIIDHLLAAPEVDRPLELVKPEAFYQFRDPELEALSAGHKAMIRMGPDNAARVKEKLRAIRAGLAEFEPPVAEPAAGAAADGEEPATSAG